MEFKQNKQIMIPVMVIAIFIFVVSFASLYTERQISCGAAQTCTIPIPFLIPITASMGVFVGTLVYYLMATKIIKKNINIDRSYKIIEKLLNKEEKDILKIITEYSEISQARLTSLAGITRLKVFRILERFKEKGLIEKHQNGKIRMIKIKEDINNIFK
ncbi:hypothetical protein KY343_01260 [Candidatus Woesearchaeota archaeon]|nr:hypothetical protein [Candidatus Woesearchaeota archaeon]